MKREEIQAKLRRFFAHRYGWDRLNRALYAAGLVLLVISLVFKYEPLSLFSAILLGLCVFRALSKDRGKRRKENQKYLDGTKPLYALAARIKNSRYYRYVHCPSCNQLAKVPKGKGKVRIRCPHCGFRYERRV